MPEYHAIALFSGGLDSILAARLIMDQGLRVKCLHFISPFFGKPSRVRHWQKTYGLDIDIVDVGEQYAALLGAGPAHGFGSVINPCVDCNRHVKFGTLLELVRGLDREAVATGHYARVEYDQGAGRWLLKRAGRRAKDQSYVLWSLTQDQLAHSRFPLGELSKEEIRAIAQEQGFGNARKKDSQDICFIPDGDYGAFLRRYTGKSYPAGDFLDENGGCLGRHGGIVDYTIGQRRGLGVSSSCGRLYVKEVRPADNTVVLSGNESLFRRSFLAASPNWIALEKLSGPLRLKAKVRYRMEEQPCVVEPVGEDLIRVCYDEPQLAITPGQSVVFYEDELVVGGAVIRRTEEA